MEQLERFVINKLFYHFGLHICLVDAACGEISCIFLGINYKTIKRSVFGRHIKLEFSSSLHSVGAEKRKTRAFVNSLL